MIKQPTRDVPEALAEKVARIFVPVIRAHWDAAAAEANHWLAQLFERGDIEELRQLKSQAEAVRVFAARRHHPDIEIAARKMMRRAEKGIRLAVAG